MTPMTCIEQHTWQYEHVTLEWFSAIINDYYNSMKNYHNAAGHIGHIGQMKKTKNFWNICETECVIKKFFSKKIKFLIKMHFFRKNNIFVKTCGQYRREIFHICQNDENWVFFILIKNEYFFTKPKTLIVHTDFLLGNI